ncbi:unnamed protein product [Ixodes persulcatus]
MNTFQPGAAVAPCSKVELSISCKNLRDTDVMSKSDPMCVVLMCRGGSQQYSEIGRTEVIKNTQDPDFVKKFVEDYYFEESQKMRFEVYDIDSKSQRLADHVRLRFLEAPRCGSSARSLSLTGSFTILSSR